MAKAVICAKCGKPCQVKPVEYGYYWQKHYNSKCCNAGVKVNGEWL